MTAVLLAIASSVCWATLDALRKALGRELTAVALVVALSLGQAILFTGIWVASGADIPSSAYLLPGGIALVANLIANLLFVRAVQVSPLSITVPFLSLTPAFSTALGIPVLGQLPGSIQLGGIALVVVGGLVLAGRDHADEPPRWKEPGVWMMLTTAAIWGSTTALDAFIVRDASPAAHGLVQTGGVGLALLGFLVVRGKTGVLKAEPKTRRLTAVAIVVACAAYGLQLFALTGVWAAVMETIKRVIGVWSAMIVGRLVFDEAITPRKIVAATLMAGGTAALALGR